MTANAKRIVRWLVASAVVIAALGGLWFVASIRADQPLAYDDAVEHFKYGSIGSEPGVSLLRPVGGTLPPYWVFKALPSVCREKLPGGYTSLGLILEEGRDLPIGVSRRRRLGVDQVGLNCAVCHTGTVRDTPQSKPLVVPGMPAHQLDLQRFIEFVTDCTLDNRLTAEGVRGRFPRSGGPGAMERLIYRVGVVDRLKLQTLDLRNRIAPILHDEVPRWGPGRVDTFAPYKAIQFNWQLDRLSRERAHRCVGLSVALESEAARGHAAALGRRQRFGRRAQSERRPGRRHHAGDGRSRGDEAGARLDLDAAATEVSVCRRCGPRVGGGSALRHALRQLPRRPSLPRWCCAGGIARRQSGSRSRPSAPTPIV